ncbi:pyrroloquinoline-quinone synthase PqqC [Kitasatospora azatica]|uniref:pyrroloquinoline-quinone synthase PqqC n=1 Tax=Kitasatospora azatica TaxID=58347 RepID=UPI000567FDC0|nr:pyrroloquinoline-quinone synthase PqqC [Kitasatospora azatica]
MTALEPLSTADFAAALYAHSERYWHNHPFHLRLHQGALGDAELRSWVANRWYYQKWLPQKDAAVVANCPVPEVRRRWIRRITDQDGAAFGQGGNADWLALAEAAGLSVEEVEDERHVLPGVRFATDAYVQFARTRPWTEAVAASLTELFSPELMRERLSALHTHYRWVDPAGLRYFELRPEVADADAAHAMELVTMYCTTREQQDAAIAALSFKCDVLWSMLDAIEHAHIGARV